MATSSMSDVLHHLRQRTNEHQTDGQLLGRFVERRDEAAFAALVTRLGPMVWGVCRRLLPEYHDAEDAFQAAFLVLARKAGSVRPRELVGNWLYGVASNVALKARALAGKRRARERQVTEMPEPEAVEQDLWRDLQPLLDRELSRLPDKYRVPVVLCDLEGKTHKEAARLLGCPEGTLSARLSRARALLAKRLTRHGLVVSAGVLAVLLCQKATAAYVPAAVIASTVKAGTLFAAGQAATGAISSQAAVLSEGVLKAMLLAKLKLLAVVVLTVGVLTGGLGVCAYRSLCAAGQPAVAQALPNAQTSSQPPAPPATEPKKSASDMPADEPKDPPKSTEPEPKLPKVTTRGGGVGLESFDQALEWMRSDNQASQLIAIKSLAQLDAPYEPRREEVTAQLEKMLNGRDRLVASKCADALYVWATKKQVPSIIKSLEDPFCQKAAMDTLGRLKDERAIEPLAKYLRSEKFFERDPAVAALIAIGPAVEKEVRGYAEDDNKEAREAAARILKQIGKTDKDDEFKAALVGLKDKNVFGKKKAIDYFATADAAHPRKEEAAKALAALYTDGDIFDKQATLKPLCRWGGRPQVPLLIDSLKEKMVGVPSHELVIKTLGALGDERAIPALGEMLANGFLPESDTAVAALVKFGPKGEEEALKHIDGDRPYVKTQVCEVLKEVGGKDSVKPLQDEIDKANREQYKGYEGVVESCKAALKKVQERTK